MNSPLVMLKQIQIDGCVSIMMNTHRNSPQSHGDVIQLKNLVKKAEERILFDYERTSASELITRLKNFVQEIDHEKNLDSLAVFVNLDEAVLHRMTIDVKDRVEIGDRFAIRDLIRAENESASYYILVLSRRNARLLEAHNDRLVRNNFRGFPVINETLFATDAHKLSTAAGQDNLIEEFFNRIDIKVKDQMNAKRLPLVIATEERNYHHYLSVTSSRKNIITHLSRNRDDEQDNHIVSSSWKLVKDQKHSENAHKVDDLKRAVSSGKFMSDINDISRAIIEGRGRTLFIQTDYYQPGVVLEDRIELLEEGLADVTGVMEDVVETLVSGSIEHGGDVVFLDGHELDKFQGLALLTRY